jgi:hypothetical protein
MGDMGNSLAIIRGQLSEADQYLEYLYQGEGHEGDLLAEYNIESAFIHTLVLLEVKGLQKTYDEVNALFQKAKKEGLCKTKMGIEEPYLVWASILRDYLNAIGTSFDVLPSATSITADLVSIIKATEYFITDKEIFDCPPANETEVHLRIEGVLRCLFPDLKHKPQLTKPIKNFEPDTGLPSVRTLIEYKFVSDEQDVKRVSDELLIDTRGYTSRDWDNFVYIIYETRRVKPESKWNEHFKECGVGDCARVIVLSGEPSKKKIRKRKRTVR